MWFSTQTASLFTCGQIRPFFFTLCYSLGVLEEICCEKSWLLDDSPSCFSVSSSLHLLHSLSFIPASFFFLASLLYHLISSGDENRWRGFLFLFGAECLLCFCAPPKDPFTVLPPFCWKCYFGEWRTDRHGKSKRQKEKTEGEDFICVNKSNLSLWKTRVLYLGMK